MPVGRRNRSRPGHRTGAAALRGDASGILTGEATHRAPSLGFPTGFGATVDRDLKRHWQGPSILIV